MMDKERKNDLDINNKCNNKKSIISRYTVLSVFFICVTIAALVFQNSNILAWYILVPIMEVINKMSFNSHVNEYNNGINLDYRRYRTQDSDKYRG